MSTRAVIVSTATATRLQSRERLLNVRRLAVDVRHEQRLTVAAERILEQVRQLRLAVRRVRATALAERDDDLLEIRERPIDVHALRA